MTTATSAKWYKLPFFMYLFDAKAYGKFRAELTTQQGSALRQLLYGELKKLIQKTSVVGLNAPL